MTPTQTFWIATKAIVFYENKVLLIRRQTEDSYAASEFDLPWWRLEFSEMPEDWLRREVMEEVGLNIEIISPSRTWSFVKDDFQLVGITYITKTIDNKIILSHEHEDFIWIEEEEINNHNLPEWLIKELDIWFNNNKKLK